MKQDARTPLILLTGFLGSGKTTWLKTALANETYGDTAVLVNEFGEVGIDHLLVDAISPDIVLLDSGCVCCQIRGELKDAVLDLLDRRYSGEIPAFSRIVVETTGLADPGQILSTFLMDPVLRHQIDLSSVVTIVDALNGPDLHANQPEWAAQVSAASLLLLSKTDLMTEDVEALDASLQALNPVAEIDTVAKVALLSDLTRKDLRFPAMQTPVVPSGSHHHGSAKTLALHVEERLDWTRFVIWLSALIHNHGDRLLRVKCLLNTEENGVVLLDGVSHTLHPPQHLDDWPDDDPRSRLVFIARGIEPEDIRRSFRAYCLSSDPVPA